MSIPVLKPGSSWFTPTLGATKRSLINTINIVDTYVPTNTVSDSWDASAIQNGSIMCYVSGTVLTISGNGSGGIKLSEDASFTFSDVSEFDMFNSCVAINGLNLLDTSDVVNMAGMFYRCNNLRSVDVSTFNTHKVANMSKMFGIEKNGTSTLASINFGANFVKSTVIDLSYMFYCLGNLTELAIDDWDISNVINMSNFSNGCSKLLTFGTNNLANWDFGNVVYMDEAFRGLLIMSELAIENWNVSRVKTMYCLFGQNEKMFSTLDLRNWDVSNVEDMSFVFWGCSSISTLNCFNWNVFNVRTFDHFIARCSNITKFNHSGWNVSYKCENLNSLFYGYQGTSIDIRGWDTKNVKIFSHAFEACPNVTVIHGLEYLDTSSGEDFTKMFANTNNLTVFNLSSFDTRNVKSGILLDANNTYGEGMYGMLPSDVNGTTKFIIGENFSFNGDGNLSSGQFASMPKSSSGTWYTIDGTAYTQDAIETMVNPAGTYYATTEAVELAVYELAGKKYVSLNAIRLYHDKCTAEVDTKLELFREELSNVEEISSDEILALFNVGV